MTRRGRRFGEFWIVAVLATACSSDLPSAATCAEASRWLRVVDCAVVDAPLRVCFPIAVDKLRGVRLQHRSCDCTGVSVRVTGIPRLVKLDGPGASVAVETTSGHVEIVADIRLRKIGRFEVTIEGLLEMEGSVTPWMLTVSGQAVDPADVLDRAPSGCHRLQPPLIGIEAFLGLESSATPIMSYASPRHGDPRIVAWWMFGTSRAVVCPVGDVSERTPSTHWRHLRSEWTQRPVAAAVGHWGGAATSGSPWQYRSTEVVSPRALRWLAHGQ